MILETLDIYKNGKILLNNIKLQSILWGTFQLDRVIQMNKNFQVKQNGIPVLTGMQKPTQKTWKFLVLLEVSLQKTKEKLKTQEARKARDHKTDVTSATALYLLLPNI